MDVRYQRDMNHNYMILQCDENMDEESFETRMIFANKIPGLLPCHIRYIDGRTYMGYEVTCRQNLTVFCENRKPGRKEIQSILGSILSTIEGMEEYLLSPDHLILDPELVLMNFETQEAALAFAPFYRKEIKSSLRELTEYLLAFLAHDDRQGIVLGYRFSHELTERNSGISELMNILYGKDEERGIDGGIYSDEPMADERDERNCLSEMPPDPGTGFRSSSMPEEDPVINMEDENFAVGSSDPDRPGGWPGSRAHRQKASLKQAMIIFWGGFFAVVAGYLILHFLLPSVSFPDELAWRVAAAVLICQAALMAGIYARKKRKADRAAPLPDVREENVYVPEKEERIRSRPETECDLWEDHSESDYGEVGPAPDIRMRGDNMTTLLTGGFGGYGKAAALIPEDASSGLPVITLSDSEVLIGKQQGLVTSAIDSPAVSRVHARIRRGEDGYYLRDLNSTNGTSVNGEAVFGNAERCLNEGDRVMLADAAYIFNT